MDLHSQGTVARLASAALRAATAGTLFVLAFAILDIVWSPLVIGLFVALLAAWTVAMMTMDVPLKRAAVVALVHTGPLGFYGAIAALLGQRFDPQLALLIVLGSQTIHNFATRDQANWRKADENARSAVLRFEPPKGQALIIVLREGKVGNGIPLVTRLGDKALPALPSGAFIAAPVPPGDLILSVHFPARGFMTDDGQAIGLAVAAGEIAVVQAIVTMDHQALYVRLARIGDLSAAKDLLQALPMAA